MAGNAIERTFVDTRFFCGERPDAQRFDSPATVQQFVGR
jgi:hypothetical protein